MTQTRQPAPWKTRATGTSQPARARPGRARKPPQRAYRPVADPASWAAAAEAAAVTGWWAIGGPAAIIAVLATAAGFAIKAAVVVRNHPVAARHNTYIALAAAALW